MAASTPASSSPTYPQILRQINAGQFSPVYLLHGEEGYFIDELVKRFESLLPEEEREDIFDIVHLKYRRRLGKKAGSIYWTYFDESDEESGPAEGREARDGTA